MPSLGGLEPSFWGPRECKGFAFFAGNVTERVDSVTSYMIPVGLEGLVRKPSLGYEGIIEGVGSGLHVGLGWDGLLGMFGPGKWPSIWDRGPGRWPVIRDRPGWPWKLERPRTLSLLSRGRPVSMQASVGAWGTWAEVLGSDSLGRLGLQHRGSG